MNEKKCDIYVGQIFGNRKIIKDFCENKDWININKKCPSNKQEYVLTQCLNCGSIIPSSIKSLKRQPPKRCVFCSNIGNHYNIKTNTNSWIINGEDAICNLIYNKKVVSFYIDKNMYEKAKTFTWRIARKKQKYYVISGSFKKKNAIYLHQFILGKKEDKEIDHIDGNSLNNRINNLRFVTHQENIDNTLATRIDNQIGIRGVSYSKKDKKFKVDFYYHGKRYYVKSWETEIEAVYCRLCLEKDFNLNMLQSNPQLKQYDFSKIDTQQIEKYVKYLETDGR